VAVGRGAACARTMSIIRLFERLFDPILFNDFAKRHHRGYAIMISDYKGHNVVSYSVLCKLSRNGLSTCCLILDPAGCLAFTTHLYPKTD
jgi:hypothetical protein